MKLLRSFAFVACLLVGTVIGASFLRQPASADDKAAPSTVGRYQVSSYFDVGRGGMIVVIDTTTGQCWLRDQFGAKWVDQGSPTKK
jgi:hypothetical protein